MKNEKNENEIFQNFKMNKAKEEKVFLCREVMQVTPPGVEAPKIGVDNKGDTRPVRTLVAAPYPFGIAGPTGDNGTSFPI